jgi:homoserine O-acetyltransferase
MTDNPDTFESSDSERHARRLEHAEFVTFDDEFPLERGRSLPQVTVAFETFGTLSTQRDNAVLICHALSGDSHVASHGPDDDPGWWDVMVGPGKPVDTDRLFVICPNVLGGCRGTTGPNSVDPRTGRPYGPDFPLITVGDMVRVQARLVDHLGIDRLRAVVGGSLGGHMALDWAVRFPDRVAGVAAIATSSRLTSQALAFDVIGRNAILRDPLYRGGQFYDEEPGPEVGLAIARMLGHITYLSREAMTQKFDADRLMARDVQTQFETKFSVGSYLAYQGDRFVERFDANSYITLSMALDLFDLGGTVEDLAERLALSQCRWLVVSFSSDWLFPPFQSQLIVDALVARNKPVSYCNVESDCGHDAFLLENNMASYGEMVRSFLANLATEGCQCSCEPQPASAEPTDTTSTWHGPTSIFHSNLRLDYDSIAGLVPRGASVLDLGCGSGGLLAELCRRGHGRLIGVELDEWAILECIRRGLNVVHADLNQGLATFADKQFDYVVLSRTLQAVTDVETVFSEMLRVGSRGIVSFPNLGYHRFRSQLSDYGRAPRIEAEEGFRWYNTPNVRFLSITDFEQFCQDKGYHIHQTLALDTEEGCQVTDNPNLNADVAICVVSGERRGQGAGVSH